ncbi:MAG: ATP-binding protein [Spirochaetales bacterium]|nr:ATP-binding protein [Spirochaetales bacterium]
MNSEILVSDTHPLMARKYLNYAEFKSDYQQIRYYTLLLVKHCRPKSDERLLLEQQVSEIIKNAIKHGNECDPSRLIKVWYRFTVNEARLIVEDEGSGFQDIEKWNLFNSKRQEYIDKEDYGALMSYASWRTAKSDTYDGGNAMFAAIEYWNQGVVYSTARNTVALGKVFSLDPIESEEDE